LSVFFYFFNFPYFSAVVCYFAVYYSEVKRKPRNRKQKDSVDWPEEGVTVTLRCLRYNWSCWNWCKDTKCMAWYGVQQTTKTTVTMKTIIVTRRIDFEPVRLFVGRPLAQDRALPRLSDVVARRLTIGCSVAVLFWNSSVTRHNKPRPVLYCGVLPSDPSTMPVLILKV